MSPRTGLTKTAVVQAAAELLNIEGADALSLNRLSGKLGIRTPSLYNHVDGLPGLQRELAIMNAKLLADRLSEAAIGKSGTELFMDVAQAFHNYVKEYPGLYISTLRSSGNQAVPDENLIREEERALKIGLAVMASLGLQGEDAMRYVLSEAWFMDLPHWKWRVVSACLRIATKVFVDLSRLWWLDYSVCKLE